MKKSLVSLLIMAVLTGLFAGSASASYDSRGAEFIDHSLIELVSANGQIGAVRVSNDNDNLVIQTYLWPPTAKFIEYHVSVANNTSGLTSGPGVPPQMGQIALSKTFSSDTRSTTDQFDYGSLNPGLIVITVSAVIQDGNSQALPVWGRGLPLTGSGWSHYFEYVKRTDTTAPQAVISVDKPVLTPPDRRMVPIAVNIDTSEPVVFKLKSITSNEPDQGLGWFDRPNDIQNAAFGSNDIHFNLRAESSIKGSGRVYTITYTLTDAAGNSSDVSTTVKVPPLDLEYIKEKLREEAVKLCEMLKKFGFFGNQNVALKIERYINEYINKKLVASYGE